MPDCAAINLAFGRVLYGSGRDRAWPEPISGWIGSIHPRLRTPWIATAFVGIVGAVLTAVSSIAVLVTFTGVTLVIIYGLIALSAVVSRVRQPDIARPYRMPLWPAPAVVALGGLVIVATQQTLRDVGIVAGFVALALIYYFVYLRGREGTHWVMLDPVEEDTEEPGGLLTAPEQTG